MDLRTAIIETYTERFGHDEHYLNGKLDKINECDTTQDLIYFSMNIDSEGLDIISKKIQFDEFKRFVFNFRSLDQNGDFH